MKLTYNNKIFEFYENFFIEKRIVETLFNYIQQFNNEEITSNYKNVFAAIKRDIDNLGFGIKLQLDFFTSNKYIFSQIRVAANAFKFLENLEENVSNVYLCGGEVYYFIIRQANVNQIYLEYQWRSLFYDLVVVEDKVKGASKQKLLNLIAEEFPTAEQLFFNKTSKGTLRAFDNALTPVYNDLNADYMYDLTQRKKCKTCQMAEAKLTFCCVHCNEPVYCSFACAKK
jgi:hypothetical protein